MAKPKKRRKHTGHGSPTPADPQAVLTEVDALIPQLEAAGGHAAGPIWGSAHKLLLKAKADPKDIMHVIATRDIDALRRLVAVLRGEEQAEAATEAEALNVDPEVMKSAMRAFRKRLKLVRLDHESRLGVGPMTGGKKHDVDAILAPREFDDEVWQALVAEGSLRYAGQGFYMLAEEAE